jgi:hypothetical protein
MPSNFLRNASTMTTFTEILEQTNPDPVLESGPEVYDEAYDPSYASSYFVNATEYDPAYDVSYAELSAPVIETFEYEIVDAASLSAPRIIDGTDDHDLLTGGPGDDGILGAGGNDFLYGGRGLDYLWGDEDDDYLFGEDGNDVLYGGPGVDRLVGGEGDDDLIGGPGVDFYWGGPGNDRFVIGLDSLVSDPDVIFDFDTRYDTLDLPDHVLHGGVGLVTFGQTYGAGFADSIEEAAFMAMEQNTSLAQMGQPTNSAYFVLGGLRMFGDHPNDYVVMDGDGNGTFEAGVMLVDPNGNGFTPFDYLM